MPQFIWIQNVYFQLVGGISLLFCVLNRFYAASSQGTVSDFVTIPELINDYFCVAMKQNKTLIIEYQNKIYSHSLWGSCI